MNQNNPLLDPDLNLEVLNNNDVFNCNYCSLDSFKTLKQQFTPNGLSVICFNIRSFSRNGDEFLGYLSNCEHNFDVIILTETWATKDTYTLCHIPGYKATHNFRKDRKGGGISIFVRETIGFCLIDTASNSNEHIESLAISFQCDNTRQITNVLGIYRPPNGDINIFTETLSDILTQHNMNATETIITGDFNICLLNEHNSANTNNFINMMNGFFFRPIITRPTRFKNNTATVIDHIWVNTVQDISSYIFYSDITDHCPVFCRINNSLRIKDELVKIKFRDMSSINKSKFNVMVSDTDWNILLRGINTTNDMVLKLLDTLDSYYNTCFPFKTQIVCVKRLLKPWITKALHVSIKTKHDLFKQVKRNNYDVNAYKRYNNTLKCLLRSSKLSYFKAKFNECRQDLKKTWSIINNTINPGRKQSSILKLCVNNHTLTESVEIAEALNSHFAGIGLALQNALPYRDENRCLKYLPPRKLNSIFLNPSTSTEVKNIIKDIKNTKGNIHTLSARILKENSDSLSFPISFIFNKVIMYGQYPSALKIACVTALFKAGDKVDPNNYRPISSLPLLNKIFEKLLHKRLTSFLETHDVFTNNQYGFRKNMSTFDAVSNLLDNIYKAMDEKESLGAVFIDLSKAFDTVPHKLLLKKLEHYGIRGNALNLIESYLSDRKQFVSLSGIRSSMKDIKIGVPQGSVLGPLLFLIYINDLPNAVKNVKSILFADDTTMFARSKNLYDLCNIISEDMLLVKEWLIANSLTLNASKSYYIIFTLKKVPNNLRITIGDHVLDRKTQGKFLGVILDEKLSFSEHIDYVTSKISKLTGLLYKLKTFFPSEILNNLYSTLIFPYFNYCILAWGSVSRGTLQPLLLYQKKLVRLITDSEFYAHTDPLFKQLKILKIDDLFTFHAHQLMFKTLVLDKYPLIKRSILDNQINHSYDTRLNSLRLPYYRIQKCKQSIHYQLPKKWNLLPTYVKNKENLFLFKKECKRLLLSRY